jgi:hypothetical protein
MLLYNLGQNYRSRGDGKSVGDTGVDLTKLSITIKDNKRDSHDNVFIIWIMIEININTPFKKL